MAAGPPSLARGGRTGQRTSACDLERGGTTLGAATNRFPTPLCGGNGSARNRRRDGNEGRNCENAPISGIAIGSRKAGGNQMNPHLTALQISECFVGGAVPFVEDHTRECAECRAKVTFLGDSLYQFRDAVERWSSQLDHAEYQVVYRTIPARAHYGSPRLAGLSSLAVHGALVAVILLLGTFQPVQSLVKQQITALEIDLRPYLAQQTKASSG